MLMTAIYHLQVKFMELLNSYGQGKLQLGDHLMKAVWPFITSMGSFTSKWSCRITQDVSYGRGRNEGQSHITHYRQFILTRPSSAAVFAGHCLILESFKIPYYTLRRPQWPRGQWTSILTVDWVLNRIHPASWGQLVATWLRSRWSD